MRKKSFVVESAGAIIFLISMCCDVAENPIVAIPIVFGLAIFAIGAIMEGA